MIQEAKVPQVTIVICLELKQRQFAPSFVAFSKLWSCPISHFVFSFKNLKDQSNEQQHANGLIVSFNIPQQWTSLNQMVLLFSLPLKSHFLFGKTEPRCAWPWSEGSAHHIYVSLFLSAFILSHSSCQVILGLSFPMAIICNKFKLQ